MSDNADRVPSPVQPETYGAWQWIESRLVSHHRIFGLHEHMYRLRDSEVRDFVVLECPDWVNVIPITTDEQVVFVRQFRHGVKEVTLEVPGGMVDEGESPAAAGLRELQEETGYHAAGVEELGYVYSNPAIQNNRTYTFVARGVQLRGELALDPFESIEVVLHPLQEIPQLLASGAIRHPLVIAAFALLGVAAARR